MKKYFSVSVEWIDDDGAKNSLPFNDVEKIDVTSNGQLRLVYWFLYDGVFVKAISSFDPSEVNIICSFILHELGRS